MRRYYPNSKARVYVSLLNSTILSIFSLYSFWNWQLHGVQYFLEQAPNYTLTNYTAGYFAVDLFLGHFFDRKNMNLLTGYIHHTVFTGLICFINLTRQPNIIYMFVPFEIPTMILDVSRINNSDLINNLFGANFFIFRVLYNVHIIKALWLYKKPYAMVTSLLLCIHSYWFKQWIDKTLRKKSNLRL